VLSTNEVVRWIGGLGAVTADALALRRGQTIAQARGALEQARRERLLTRVRPLRGQPALYAATRHGLCESGVSRLIPCSVTNGNAQHLIVCAAVAAALAHRHPEYRVEGERGLRALEQEASRALVSARLGAGPDGAPRLHRPDLVLWPRVPGERPVAVEVELTIKAPQRLTALCRAWARCPLVAGVIYYAPPNVARALDRAVARTQAAEHILVAPLAAVMPRR
jgi:hypothetical protein